MTLDRGRGKIAANAGTARQLAEAVAHAGDMRRRPVAVAGDPRTRLPNAPVHRRQPDGASRRPVLDAELVAVARQVSWPRCDKAHGELLAS